MRHNFLILTIVGIGCVLLLQAGCQERAGVPEGPAAVLSESAPAIAPTKAEFEPGVSKAVPKIVFEKVTHDFGEIGPATAQSCEFKFRNTGDALLKIRKVKTCCGVTADLGKKEYAPGQSGTVKVRYKASQRAGKTRKRLFVHSNDETKPKVTLTLKAGIVSKVDYQPKKLNLSLRAENADCPTITLTSIDNQPFAIKRVKSTGDCIKKSEIL